MTNSEVATLLIDRQAVTPDDPITLGDFKEIYLLLEGANRQPRWVLLMLGDQILAKTLDIGGVTITIQEKKARFYSLKELGFTKETDAAILGTTQGRYGFGRFLSDALGVWRFPFAFSWLVLGYGLYGFVPTGVMLVLANSLLLMMTVFVPVFAVFTINSVADKIYSLIASDKYYRLSQGDKYIAVLALLSLLFSAIAAVFCTMDPCKLPDAFSLSPYRVVQAITTDTAVILAIIALFLVIRYHFNRQREIMERIMALRFLEEQESHWVSQNEPHTDNASNS